MPPQFQDVPGMACRNSVLRADVLVNATFNRGVSAWPLAIISCVQPVVGFKDS